MKLTLDKATLTATRETGDARVSNESHLLHRIKVELIALGFDVIKKRMWRDGHLVGDNQQYIRTRKPTGDGQSIAVYDGSYAIRDAAQAYNKDGRITLTLIRDYFREERAHVEPVSVVRDSGFRRVHESDMDEFTRAYIACALWSTTGDNDEPLDKAHGFADFSAEALMRALEDCRTFQSENAQDLSARPLSNGGHDFWLTRNHHGAGFWDGDWPEGIADRLTQACAAYGELDLYKGDDGLLYF